MWPNPQETSLTAQKMKFSIKDFLGKLQIWSYLPKKSLMENLIFCAVSVEEFFSFIN